MSPSTEKLILDQLCTLHEKVDGIALTITGDGDKKKGLVRRLDAQGYQIKELTSRIRFAAWVVGLIFTSAVAAEVNHLFDAPKTAAMESHRSEIVKSKH